MAFLCPFAELSESGCTFSESPLVGLPTSGGSQDSSSVFEFLSWRANVYLQVLSSTWELAAIRSSTLLSVF